MAIVDPQLVINMPKSLTAWGGIDALVHALESYVSVLATGGCGRVWERAGKFKQNETQGRFQHGHRRSTAFSSVHLSPRTLPLLPLPLPTPSDYTKGLSREAISLLFKFLPRSYKNGPNDYLVGSVCGAGWWYCAAIRKYLLYRISPACPAFS